MGLPSQGGRTAGGMAGRGRRKKRGKSKGALAPFLAIAVVGAAGWLIVTKAGGLFGDGPASADAAPTMERPTDPVTQPFGTGDESPANGRATKQVTSPVTTPDTELNTAGAGQPDTSVGVPDPLAAQTQRAQTQPAPAQPLPVAQQPEQREQQTRRPATSSRTFAAVLSESDRLVAENRLVDARSVLNRELVSGALSEPDAAIARGRLTLINQDLFFSPRVIPGDALSESYAVESGDSLARIENKRNLACDWRLIQRINRISDPRRIRVGQQLKLVRGPFHAEVDKTDFRMDVYAGPPGMKNEWTYITSFPVGLGELDGTPVGQFVVRTDSKLINPYWVNPRTGERFEADNPENPIGEHWIGLDGVGPAAAFTGYGIHGTIDPDSIGRSRSMGCVRMRDGDVAVVYEMLIEGISEVEITE